MCVKLDDGVIRDGGGVSVAGVWFVVAENGDGRPYH